MAIKKKIDELIRYVRGRLLWHLWAAIMLLVGFAVVFLWVVQIQLFEPNYIDAATADLLNRVNGTVEEIAALEQIQPDRDNPLYYLSKTINGKLYLVDEDGSVLFAYNRAPITEPDEIMADYDWIIADRYQKILDGEIVKKTEKHTGKTIIILGAPAFYQGRPAAIMMYNSLTEIDAMLSLNRRQLSMLTIVLTLAASMISFALARHFARPIMTIQRTVERLTEGELTATPKIRRKDELGKLSDSVTALGKELQRVDVLRKEVIANVSHELRAPLSLITGYSEMVRDVTGPKEELRNQNMDLIIREAHRLSEMVDDIMDYSQLQAGYSELKLEVCNLFEIVEFAVEYAQAIAGQYQIQVDFKSFSNDIPICLDALKISQVLRNLLNNAINHVQNGKVIAVEISGDKDLIQVSVTNPGKTIPPEQIECIWERYQRVQHQGERREGTGIGLAIVSTILQAHGMEYGVNSENGISCFWFTIHQGGVNE